MALIELKLVFIAVHIYLQFVAENYQKIYVNWDVSICLQLHMFFLYMGFVNIEMSNWSMRVEKTQDMSCVVHYIKQSNVTHLCTLSLGSSSS